MPNSAKHVHHRVIWESLTQGSEIIRSSIGGYPVLPAGSGELPQETCRWLKSWVDGRNPSPITTDRDARTTLADDGASGEPRCGPQTSQLARASRAE